MAKNKSSRMIRICLFFNIFVVMSVSFQVYDCIKIKKVCRNWLIKKYNKIKNKFNKIKIGIENIKNIW